MLVYVDVLEEVDVDVLEEVDVEVEDDVDAVDCNVEVVFNEVDVEALVDVEIVYAEVEEVEDVDMLFSGMESVDREVKVTSSIASSYRFCSVARFDSVVVAAGVVVVEVLVIGAVVTYKVDGELTVVSVKVVDVLIVSVAEKTLFSNSHVRDVLQ